MDWSDTAIVLSARRHGESSAVLQAFTRERGRHAGLVRGGAGPRGRGGLQAGNVVALRWRGRLAEHLGTYAVEVEASHGVLWLDDPARLAAVLAACALAESTLPEHLPYPQLHDALAIWLGALAHEDWAAAYVRWEVGLLSALGYGLDLARCAVTGGTEDLAYVSPRTGRAVSRGAAEPYRDRLLPLPGFLLGEPETGGAAVLAGLALTGHFLRRDALGPAHQGLPPARERLEAQIARAAADPVD